MQACDARRRKVISPSVAIAESLSHRIVYRAKLQKMNDKELRTEGTMLARLRSPAQTFRKPPKPPSGLAQRLRKPIPSERRH
jgi:hypothetical protein